MSATPLAPTVGPPQAEARTRRIAVLGATGTGKSTLVRELAAHLRERGLNARAVPEGQRERSTRATPVTGSARGLAIAREHEARVAAACADAEIVIADGTALMPLVRAGQGLEDGALQRFAGEAQRGYDATLVTGLDIAGPQDAVQREAACREREDALLREHLQRAGVAYQVVYGHGPQRLRAALRALVTSGVLRQPMDEGDGEAGSAGAGWVRACEKCSDPACEHRLFAMLKSERG